MSKAANSPTARLLQSSRLFSLPRPLPAASLETPSSTGTYRASDSATKLYPTHQAIATPASSHSRGDWGLKRAIPGRTTRSSTPSIRVLGQDTPDHITEFESATDHERSREKWNEMGVPIVMKGKKDSSGSIERNLSAYEDFLDNTDPNAQPVELRHRTKGRDKRSGMPTTIEPSRWKYSGPHIGAMQEGEFQRYVQRELKERTPEWEQFLIGEFAKEDLRKQRDDAFANARHFGPIETAPPERKKDMIVRDAERKASEMLAATASSLDPEVETRAREEGERLVAEARMKAQEHDEEIRRLAAPFDARNVLDRAERQAAIDRATIQRDNDPFAEAPEDVEEAQAASEERARAVERNLENAAREVHRILGAVDDIESATIESAHTLITRAEAASRAEDEAKLQIQREWESARLLSLRLSGSALADRQKEIREDHASNRLSSSLTKYICTFLDIPAVYSLHDGTSQFDSHIKKMAETLEFSLAQAEDAPPTTHPAAGLSHLRSNAILPNHPLYGPQARSSPILARVLQARNSSREVLTYATLGVGGFVARDSATSTFQNNRGSNAASQDPTQQFDTGTSGGGKVWVHPKQAYVDESGRIHLSVERADEEAKAIREGKVDELEEKRGAGSFRPESVMPVDVGSGARKANYGTSLPDMRRRPAEGRSQLEGFRQRQGRGRSGVRGFDEELGRDGVDEQSAMRRIAELSRQG